MATYEQIRDNILTMHGKYAPNCWIAHVKEQNGLNPRPAPNRQSLRFRMKPCPADAKLLIEASMRRFGMI